MKCPSCGFDNIDGADECGSCSEPLTDIPGLSGKKGMEKRIIEGLVSDLSPKRAITVSAVDPLEKAVEIMRQEKVGCVLALDGGRLAGVLSERELVLRTADSTDLKTTPVREIMRVNPTCLKEGDQVADVFHRMALSNHRHVPVQMKDGSFGVVSARDLLRYLCK